MLRPVTCDRQLMPGVTRLAATAPPDAYNTCNIPYELYFNGKYYTLYIIFLSYVFYLHMQVRMWNAFWEICGAFYSEELNGFNRQSSVTSLILFSSFCSVVHASTCGIALVILN